MKSLHKRIADCVCCFDCFIFARYTLALHHQQTGFFGRHVGVVQAVKRSSVHSQQQRAEVTVDSERTIATSACVTRDFCGFSISWNSYLKINKGICTWQSYCWNAVVVIVWSYIHQILLWKQEVFLITNSILPSLPHQSTQQIVDNKW